MFRKTTVIPAAVFFAAAVCAAGRVRPVNDQPKPAMEAASADPVQAARTAESAARAIAAIPLVRSHGLRILPVPDSEGNPIAIGSPLLAFRILPFPDDRGNLIPIVQGAPAILPFLDRSGETIPIAKPKTIEPLVQ